jgi:hypothetical protein
MTSGYRQPMPALHFFNDHVLPLPVMAIGALVLSFWTAIALLVHLVVIPRLCGRDGQRFGAIHSEVPSLVALTLGLFVSFNAVWIWERHERVGKAIIDEATALTSVLDDADGLSSAPAANALRLAVANYATNLITVEWPELANWTASSARPDELDRLRVLVRGSGDADMVGALHRAEEARDLRINTGLASMSTTRWTVLIFLGVLAIFSFGLLHADSAHARLLALGIVTASITVCLVVMLVNARPFVGALAFRPDQLELVLKRAESSMTVAVPQTAPQK